MRKFYIPFGDGGGGEGEETVKIEPSESLKDFNAKFAASRDGVGMLPKPQVKEVIEEPKVEEKKPEVKKPGSNVPKIIEDKRRAEQERDELKLRTEKFEKEDKPALESKIADLEKRIAEGGNTKAQEEALQKRLDEAEGKLAERETTLVNENKTLRDRLSFHDIQSDPGFQKKYVEPINNAYTDMVESFQADPAKMAVLRKALSANGAALSSKDPSERLAQEKLRNETLSQLTESLGEFERTQFTVAANQFIRGSKVHATALLAHEETRGEITKERQAESAKQRGKVFEEWTSASDQIAPTYDKDAEFDEELSKVMKELKLDPEKEVKASAEIIKRVITARGTTEESVHLLHKGRVYPALVAKVKAQEHMIKEFQETIAKLRGTRENGSGKVAAGGTTKTTLAEFHSRFAASKTMPRR